MAKDINIGGRLHSIATGNVVAGANEILDDNLGKKQTQINTETYSLVESINNALAELSPDQQEALGVAAKANANEAKLGYYVCDTGTAVAAKTIAATGYVLTTGGSIKVKMTNDNTVNNATLNINSTGAKPLFYEGVRASSTNTWAGGAVLEIYYDGTNYQAKNVSPTFRTGEKVNSVGVDDEPTAGSENVVKSGGIYQHVERRINNIQTAEVHITDTTGNFFLIPNTFYIFDNIIEDVNIVLSTPVSGKLSEYTLEFTCDGNSQINFPNTLRWIDNEPLEPEQGYTYQVSIVDGRAVYGAWEGGQND